MAKFVFKLDGLLRQRKREEQDRQRVLAEHAAVVNALEESVRQVNEQMHSATEDARKHLMGRLDMGFLAAHRRFMATMQRQGTGLVHKLVQAQIRVTESRVKLADAAKRRKAIEKLREKKLERWRADEARKEAVLSDEIGSQIGYHNMLKEAIGEQGIAGEMEAVT